MDTHNNATQPLLDAHAPTLEDPFVEQDTTTSVHVVDEVDIPPVSEANESIRDLDKLIQNIESEGGEMRRAASHQVLSNLMYPELTPSRIAVPGGFRRHHVGQEQFSGAAQFVSWISTAFDPSMLLYDSDDEEEVLENDSRLSSTKKTAFTLFKSFVGTGILFLPDGFSNAGFVAGTITMGCIGMLSLYGMMLLIKARARFDAGGSVRSPLLGDSPLITRISPGGTRSRKPKPLSYATLAKAAVGVGGSRLVNLSIMFSQLGFCCVYMNFIPKLMNEMFESLNVYQETPSLTYTHLIMGILIPLLIPLTFIRHLKYFIIPNLLADVFIVVSVLYISGVAISVIAQGNLPPWSCDTGGGCFWIEPKSFLMFFGTSVYSFEGISMVIPVQNSMSHPEDLPSLLTKAMFIVTAAFTFFGAVNFFAYRDNTAQVITSNLPNAGKYAVTLMFVVVALFMFPLMLFPASKIVERKLFKRERNSGYKWSKNSIRVCAVLFCAGLSYLAGPESIDSMVAVIGGLFCVPLALIFPPLLYLNIHGEGELGWWDKLGPRMLLSFGGVCMVVSTYSAITHWGS